MATIMGHIKTTTTAVNTKIPGESGNIMIKVSDLNLAHSSNVMKESITLSRKQIRKLIKTIL
jgi:hypothetical protein